MWVPLREAGPPQALLDAWRDPQVPWLGPSNWGRMGSVGQEGPLGCKQNERICCNVDHPCNGAPQYLGMVAPMWEGALRAADTAAAVVFHCTVAARCTAAPLLPLSAGTPAEHLPLEVAGPKWMAGMAREAAGNRLAAGSGGRTGWRCSRVVTHHLQPRLLGVM